MYYNGHKGLKGSLQRWKERIDVLVLGIELLDVFSSGLNQRLLVEILMGLGGCWVQR